MIAPTSRPTALVAHPFWGRGGAEAAAMWIVQALVHDFNVTVYTRGGFNLQELNDLAGTTIKFSEIKFCVAKNRYPWLPGALAHGLYLASLKSIGAGYDLRVTASGVVHWGLPAIHFISSAIWNDQLATKFDAPNAPHRQNVAVATAWRLASVMSGERRRSLIADRFVANSNWTALEAAPYCPGSIAVIHPVVPMPPVGPGWDEREDGVLVFGRVSPEKQIEVCIDIVDRLRNAGYPLRLCIAGPNGEARYSDKINSLSRERSDWIQRLDLVVGKEKYRLLGRFRYGLNACAIEAFGIATAEMSAAGIVALVPKSGAQREILGDSMQLYDTVDDAVGKFRQILTDRALQLRLHDTAIALRGRFGPERFIEEVRDLARSFVDRSRSKGGVRRHFTA